jgi:hypothetical protein
MADDKTQRAPRDPDRVSLDDDRELAYWTAQFDITRERLEEAVSAVGNSAEQVRRYLAEDAVAPG